MKAYLYLATAIVLEVIATSFLKASDGFSKPLPTAVTALGYIGSFYCLSVTLRSMSTGVAYAIWSGVGVVLISLVSWAVYRQKLDAPALAGMALIVAGVVVINLFSKSVSH